MALTAHAFGPIGLRMGSGDINLNTDTLKATLHTSSYTPDADSAYFSAVSNEVTGTGYTAGGETLTSVGFAYVGASNWTALTAAPTVWSTASLTWRYLVLRKDTGSFATDPLILWLDFGVDQTISAADININWADVLRLVV